MRHPAEKDAADGNGSARWHVWLRYALFGLFIFFLLLLQRTTLTDWTVLHMGADLLLGPLCWLACRRGILPTGIYALCVGMLLDLSGSTQVVFMPLLYLLLGAFGCVCCRRLFVGKFGGYLLILCSCTLLRSIAELCFAMVRWQQVLSVHVILQGTLPRFLFSFAAGMCIYPICNLLLADKHCRQEKMPT